MKRSELLVSTLLVPLDAVMIFTAFILSYYFRVESGALPVSFVLPFDSYVQYAVLITAVWLVIFALLGLYALRSTRRGLTEFSRILAGVLIGTLAVVALLFFTATPFFSRLVIIFGFVASLVLVTAARLVVRILQQGLFRYGIGVRRAVIVGTGHTAQVLAAELTRTNQGYQILGYLGRRQNSLPVIGSVSAVSDVLADLQPDELIEADPELSDLHRLELIAAAEAAHVEYRFTSSLTELSTSRVEVSAVGGVPIMTLQHTPLEGWGRVIKRLCDITGSLLALPVILLLYPFIAVAIKLDSAGPVLFKQTRVGRGGREFASYKFRSMVNDAESQLARLRSRNEASGPVFKMKNDPRVTKVGRFLRRSSLDELPQVFNVLKGDMSLVGPRPPLPREVAEYGRRERRRLTIKPGITGPWQVSGRSDISFDEWVRLDVYYIQHWSLLLDLTILLKTVKVVLLRQGAY